MTMPALPQPGATNWYPWAQQAQQRLEAVGNKVTGYEVTDLRIIDASAFAVLDPKNPTTVYLVPGAGLFIGSLPISQGAATPEDPEKPDLGDTGSDPQARVPQNLAASIIGTDVIKLDWEPVVSANGYAVFEERSGTTNPVAVVTTPTRTSGKLGTVTNPVYKYWVRARFPDGTQGDPSATVTVDLSAGPDVPPNVDPADTSKPSVPPSLAVTTVSTSALSVTWGASTDNVGVDQYQVRRGTTTVYSGSTRSFTDVGLVDDTTYSYTVRAVDAAGNPSDWSAAVTGETMAVTTTPPPTGGSAVTFATNEQIATFSTTSAAALRAKAVADAVKNGTASNNLSDVNTRVGVYALTTALWWARTNDSSYLAPLKAYILKAPMKPSGIQALNYFRGMGSLFAAVAILQQKGAWTSTDDAKTITGSYGGTWQNFINGLENRADYTGNGRWKVLKTTAIDSANNWGQVAKWALLMLAVIRGDSALQTQAANLVAKFLGQQVTGVADFNSSNDFIASWYNWSSLSGNGAGQKLKAGVGKRDASKPGLDGVVLDDINRGKTGYDASKAFYGATGSGITYPLEGAEYIYAAAAALMNGGYPVRDWGDDGLDRMTARFARKRVTGEQSQFESAASSYALYKHIAWVAQRLSQTVVQTSATSSAEGSLARGLPIGDWVAEAGTTWGQ